MNKKFQNALAGKNFGPPPVWFMRQAGRYHAHYQGLRAQHSFIELCKDPTLAAQVALGPVEDFGFDVAILFSDILFHLEVLGLGLDFTDSGPRLGWHIQNETDLLRLKEPVLAARELAFQGEALALTRKQLSDDKSLIGFLGGPFTLFSYAVQGRHEGGLIETKKRLHLAPKFFEILLPLMEESIQSHLSNHAECVMIFDTAAGELSPLEFKRVACPALGQLFDRFPGKLFYYSRGLTAQHFDSPVFGKQILGLGFDHRWELPTCFDKFQGRAIQGNFDQALLFQDPLHFKDSLRRYLDTLKLVPKADRARWVAGLGHGVLPKTPEANVRTYVDTLRQFYEG